MKAGKKINIYIYVDDIRKDDTWYLCNLANDGWSLYICCNYQKAIDVLRERANNDNIIIDLDHDLGKDNRMDNHIAPSGYDICKYIVENQIPIVGFHIHSMNPVGAANMRQLLTHYGYREL